MSYGSPRIASPGSFQLEAIPAESDPTPSEVNWYVMVDGVETIVDHEVGAETTDGDYDFQCGPSLGQYGTFGLAFVDTNFDWDDFKIGTTSYSSGDLFSSDFSTASFGDWDVYHNTPGSPSGIGTGWTQGGGVAHGEIDGDTNFTDTWDDNFCSMLGIHIPAGDFYVSVRCKNYRFAEVVGHSGWCLVPFVTTFKILQDGYVGFFNAAWKPGPDITDDEFHLYGFRREFIPATP